MYSISDLVTAKGVLSTQAQYGEDFRDLSGNPIVPQEFIIWANKVIAFFDKLYTIARECTGHWSCRISLAWRELRSVANRTSKHVKRLVRMGAKIINGTWVIPCKDKVSDISTLPIRSDRSNAKSDHVKLSKGITDQSGKLLASFFTSKL